LFWISRRRERRRQVLRAGPGGGGAGAQGGGRRPARARGLAAQPCRYATLLGFDLRPTSDALGAPAFVLTGAARASDVPDGAFAIDNRTPWEREEAEGTERPSVDQRAVPSDHSPLGVVAEHDQRLANKRTGASRERWLGGDDEFFGELAG
jgi:hypothetical protein